jgi:transposase
MNETTHTQYSTFSTLYLAFELSNTKWKLGFTIGLGQPPRERSIDAGDLLALQEEIRLAKKRFHLAEDTRVLSCYQAGRDGFWLHRFLLAHEVENLIVDAASIEVPRRAKRAKTDRMDVGKLLTMLIRFDGGEEKVWSVVHVPIPEVEDKRHLHRELTTLKTDRTRYTNCIKGLLVGQGARMPVKADHGAGGGAQEADPHLERCERGKGKAVAPLVRPRREQRLAVRDGVLRLA